MDFSDVRNIQFLDLSNIDDNERFKIISSLEKNDPSVELPWIKPQKKVHYPGIQHKKTVQANVSVPNNIQIFNSVPVAIVSHNQSFEPTQVVSLPYGYPNHVLPNSNPVFFNSPISPVAAPAPYPAIIHPNLNHITPKAVIFPANFNSSLPGETISFNQPLHHVAATGILNNIPPPVQNNVNVVQNNVEVVATKVEAPTQNGLENTVKQNDNTASGNKSWASLFNSAKASNDQQAPEAVAKSGQAEAVTQEANNNDVICPFKNPKKNEFFDPDCYRMGEFLIDYTVDGKTLSLQPRGLINQSNYCYINSILQALIACPPLYNLLCNLAQNITSNVKRKPTPVIDGMCKFVKEFKHLPAGQRVGRRTDKNQKNTQGVSINCDLPFEANWIYRLLNGIQTDLIEGRQEDAEEFLGCLLNGLNDEMLELIKLVKTDVVEKPIPNEEGDMDKEWLVMGKKKCSVTRRTDFDRTPISDIFGGFLKSRIHRTGDHVTENIQPFFTLPLNIETVNTVPEALEALVTKYQLEGVTSSKTNEEVEAWQQVMLDELPVILILHLKCFDFKLDGCKKIIKALKFPIDLKIDSKLLSNTNSPNKKQYKLFAIVYHDGKEASKGHYITDAFHVGYNSWLRYDDASVKPVPEEHVLKPQGTRVPYLLFYRRSGTNKSK